MWLTVILLFIIITIICIIVVLFSKYLFKSMYCFSNFFLWFLKYVNSSFKKLVYSSQYLWCYLVWKDILVICIIFYYFGGSLVTQMEKKLPATQEKVFNPWVEKIPWKREWLPTPVFLPGNSMDWGAWWAIQCIGHKGSDTTEQLTLSLTIIIGK